MALFKFTVDKEKGSVIVYGCFISTVRWKYSLFLQFSPWLDSLIRHFIGYPFGTSRKKHQPFSITQPFFFVGHGIALLGCAIGNGWCFISWNFKGIANKMSRLWSLLAEKSEKSIYLSMLRKWNNHVLMTGAFVSGCAIGSGWCFISWSSKGITNKIPQSWGPAAEK